MTILFLVVSGFLLMRSQDRELGWITLVPGLAGMLLLERDQAKALLLPYVLLAILGITPIGTDLSNSHMAAMGAALIAAITIPVLLDRKWLGRPAVIRFPWQKGRPWNAREWGYIALTLVIAYFLLPYYLRQSGAYLNWSVDATGESVVRLFIGTNAVGFWDELAFVVIVLSVLRRFLPFWWANLFQTIIFTSFLYELGFTSWGLFFIFPFAFLQGFMFKISESLAYVVTIHLSLDFVLFLAIVNAHHPEWCGIFLT